MRPLITFSFISLLMMPSVVKGAVIINEINWMGDTVSVNHEWIELYNTGDSAVVLDGWMLKDGLNLEIPINGNIEAKDYAVLKRTSEESAPGTALLIYTGALINTGATLTLFKANGEIEDQVAGDENWVGVGGDNTTKETAQYTSSGWVTDEATPGVVNKTGRVENEAKDNSALTTTLISNSSNESKVLTSSNKNDTVRLVTLDTELKLELDFQTFAYINQSVNFSAEGSGIGENIINSLNYTWNFGDADTAMGKKVTHAYDYPGTYVVTLRANYARHNQVVRQEITVLPVTFSITKNEAGDIQIHNDALYDVDLSSFMVQGNSNFIFPPDTIIIPRGTITINANKLGLQNIAQTVALFDQEKTLVASTVGPSTLSKSTAGTFATAKVSTYEVPTDAEMILTNTTDLEPTVTAFNFARSLPADNRSTLMAEIISQEPVPLLSTTDALAAGSKVALTETKKDQQTENSWAYLALIGLLFLGFVGLLLRPNNSVKERV